MISRHDSFQLHPKDLNHSQHALLSDDLIANEDDLLEEPILRNSYEPHLGAIRKNGSQTGLSDEFQFSSRDRLEYQQRRPTLEELSSRSFFSRDPSLPQHEVPIYDVNSSSSVDNSLSSIRELSNLIAQTSWFIESGTFNLDKSKFFELNQMTMALLRYVSSMHRNFTSPSSFNRSSSELYNEHSSSRTGSPFETSSLLDPIVSQNIDEMILQSRMDLPPSTTTNSCEVSEKRRKKSPSSPPPHENNSATTTQTTISLNPRERKRLQRMNRLNRTLKQNPHLRCTFCGTRDTPEWRKGPEGNNTLCNACGIRWGKEMRQKKSLKKSPEESTK
jgi:hypothetical protein